MAHPDQKVAQSARRMAHPVRHGPIWWLRRAVAASAESTGRPSSAAARFLLRFMPKKSAALGAWDRACSAGRRGRDFGEHARRLGRPASASPSPALLANLTSVTSRRAQQYAFAAETSPDRHSAAIHPRNRPPHPICQPAAVADAEADRRPTKSRAKVYTFVALAIH